MSGQKIYMDMYAEIYSMIRIYNDAIRGKLPFIYAWRAITVCSKALRPNFVYVFGYDFYKDIDIAEYYTGVDGVYLSDGEHYERLSRFMNALNVYWTEISYVTLSARWRDEI